MYTVNNLMRTLQAIPPNCPVLLESFGMYEELNSSPFEFKKISKIRIKKTGEELWVSQEIIESEICNIVNHEIIETKTVVILKKE